MTLAKTISVGPSSSWFLLKARRILEWAEGVTVGGPTS
jgi:hypothetical protein